MGLKDVKEILAEMLGTVPQGFNNKNSVEYGHIALMYDQFVISAVGGTPTCPAAYAGLFDRGTKPSEWSGNAPSYENVRE